MRPKSPCLGCTSRSELCHGSCEKYIQFKQELERVKAAERRNNPADEYVSDKVTSVMRRNFLKYDKRNRKHY